MNRRHELDSALVAAQTKKSIEWLKQRLQEYLDRYPKAKADYDRAIKSSKVSIVPPETPEQLQARFARDVKYEQDYYGKVRVIELDLACKDRYLLVYGDEDDNNPSDGTGPWPSLQEAMNWFYKGGR